MTNETTIGEKLRQARLNKQLSLDELQQMTKIQRRYLEAMEAGRFDMLPGTFYARAFIRQYAAAVEEDGEKLVAVFDGKASFEPPLPKRPRPETVKGSRTAMHVEEKQGSWVVRYLPMILLGLIALTIVGIVGYMTWQERNTTPIIQTSGSSFFVESNEQSSSSAEETTTSTIESTSTEASSTVESTEEKMTVKLENSTQTDATIAITNAENPIKLDFTGLDGRCWVGILVNNAYVYQNTFEANTKQSMTLPENTTTATIVLGASQNMSIQANGVAVDFNDPAFEALQKNVHLQIQYKE